VQQALPTVLASLNVCSGVLLVLALVAIRARKVERHRRLMLANLALAGAFLVAYVTQTVLFGHERFPGEGSLRSVFLVILTSHTVLAVSLLGLVPRTVYLALRKRFEAHRRIAPITMAIWLYVSATGVVVYWMLHHLTTAAPISGV
jgi:putative membrane protein